MLISLSREFIFIANVKTASTSIEKALQDYAEIRLVRSEWGKHVSLGHAELRFSRIFELVPRHKFRVIAVMREPLDWLGSLYRSHKHPKFQNTPLNTADITMTEFLTKWRPRNPGQCVSQTSGLRDFHARFGADFLLRYEELPDDFGEVCDLLGLPLLKLPRENTSEYVGEAEDIPTDVLQDVKSAYWQDFHACGNLTGRLLTEEEKTDAFAMEKHVDRIFSNGADTYSLSRDEVFSVFRTLLGREPESNKVVREHRCFGTVEALHGHIMASKEYQSRQEEIAEIEKAAN